MSPFQVSVEAYLGSFFHRGVFHFKEQGSGKVEHVGDEIGGENFALGIIYALEQQLSADPDNLELRCQLAVQYTSSGQYKEAMEYLVGVLTIDREHADGATKKALLDTIASLGKGDPLAVEFQRKLYSLLY